MNEYTLEDINNEKYVELILNIDDTQFTLISVTGLIDPTLIDTEKKFSKMHYHDCYEVFCIEDGDLTLKLEDEDVTYSKRELIIISPYVNHTVISNNTTNKGCERILFSAKKNSLKNAYHIYEKLSSILKEPVLSFKVNSYICEKFMLLKDAVIAKDKLMASLYFHEIITVIIKTAKEFEENTSANIAPDSTTSRSHKIHMMLNQYYTQDISLEYIARNLNLSTRQVSRFIKQHYGCTYKELVCEMRMKTAMELILSSKLTITEIAMEVGFKSSKGFYKSFKSYYGNLPSKFRKKTSSQPSDI